MRPHLYPYQLTGAEFLALRKAALLADEPGLGKTAQAIAACDIVDAERILVLCPASARVNWAREFAKFQAAPRPVAVLRTGKDAVPATGVAITSYDLAAAGSMHEALTSRNWDVLILDEGHFLKTRNARRTVAAFGKAGTGGLAALSEHVYVLTGTPAPNNPAELFPMMRALFSEAITRPTGKALDYWGFVQRYCDTYDNGFGPVIRGGRNLKELKIKLAPHMLRRLKADVLPDLPPIRFEEVALDAGKLDLPGEELAAVRKALADTEDPVRALKQVAGHVATLRRLTGLAKVAPVVEMLKDEISGGLQKIVLFAHHRDVVLDLAAGFKAAGIDYAVLDGSTDGAVRQARVDAFQNLPGVKVFIGQLQAAGTAITLTAASDVLFVENSWVPAENQQAAMRCHRIGQKNSVLVRFAMLAGSIDEDIVSAVRRKTATITELGL